MDKFDRIYQLHRILAGRRTPISFEDPIKDPARIAWHEVIKVQHYWLEVDAMAQPLKVGEPDSPTYKGKGS